jgi:hypothetical protein
MDQQHNHRQRDSSNERLAMTFAPAVPAAGAAMMGTTRTRREAPMRYAITEHDGDVEIRVHQTGEHTPQVLASLQDCQHGRCGCPTDQYDRLEEMTIHTGPDELTIRLHPRQGQRFDTDELQSCLDHTITEAHND